MTDKDGAIFQQALTKKSLPPGPGPTRAFAAGKPARVSKELLALARREYPKHFSVLGYGAPGDLNAVALCEKLDDLLVGQRVPLVLLVDNLLDCLLDTLACNVLVSHAPDRRVEKVLELEQ